MGNNRAIEVLKHRISELESKISAHERYGISEKKTEKLRILKLKYETQLEELEYAD